MEGGWTAGDACACALQHARRPQPVVHRAAAPCPVHAGAEIVRMLQTCMGRPAFAAGLRAFLAEHRGKAATCEQLLESMAAAAGSGEAGGAGWSPLDMLRWWVRRRWASVPPLACCCGLPLLSQCRLPHPQPTCLCLSISYHLLVSSLPSPPPSPPGTTKRAPQRWRPWGSGTPTPAPTLCASPSTPSPPPGSATSRPCPFQVGHLTGCRCCVAFRYLRHFCIVEHAPCAHSRCGVASGQCVLRAPDVCVAASCLMRGA